MTDLKSRYLAHVQVSTPLVEAALNHAFQELDGDTSGHDPYHVVRVFTMA